MINKKIIRLFISALTVTTVALTAQAATTLSDDTIQQCKDYVNNPSAQSGKTHAAALQACYDNYACQNNSELSKMPNCLREFNKWATQVKNPTSTPQQKALPPAEKMQTPPVGTITEPTVAPTTTPETQPVAQPPQENNNKNKEGKPSINWF